MPGRPGTLRRMGLLEQNSGPAQLRRLLSAAADHRRPVLAPGAHDALSARLVEEAGFSCVYMTGFGTAAAMLGRPDLGLVTATEMADTARRIVDAVGTPVICDADTGYGGTLNVVRTVRGLERAGVAALHIEDQAAPKRCGHLAGKALVEPAEMEARVRAAVAARQDPDLVIIARTDARAVEGMRSALDRAARFLDAGADMLFVEAPESEDEIEAIATRFAGTPLLFNWAEGGRTPPLALERLAELGFSLVIFPIGLLLAATAAMRSHLADLARKGTPASALPGLPAFTDMVRFLGLEEAEALDARLSDT